MAAEAAEFAVSAHRYHILTGNGCVRYFGDIIVNQDVRIGENCTLYPGVLIGQKDKGLVPVIGNNVFIGAGTKIIGDVQIGNNVIIGQNCVVTKNIPDNKVVVVNNNLRFLK